MTLALTRPLARVARVSSPAPRPAWEQLVGEDPDAIVTQTPCWTDAAVATGTFVDRSRLYELDDGRRFVLPLLHRRGPGGAILGNQGFPNGWGIGGLVGPGLDAATVSAVFEDLRSSSMTRVQIRPNPLHGELYRAAAPSWVLALPRRAHVIDMAGGADDVWGRMSQAARRGVRKGERTGLEVEQGHGEKLVREYYELHRASVERWAEQQHEPRLLARLRAEHRDGLDKWLTIARVLGPRCSISVARLQGRPVGATVLLVGPNGHETRSAFDREAAAGSDPVYLLRWLGIQAAEGAGTRWYHLGESGTSARLADFKERFAARPYDYAEYRIERLPVTRADSAARRAVKRMVGFKD